MSDPLPTDAPRAFDAASEPRRDAKIEQLLLVGLDHYFAAQYEQAINVWTRALFLDRSHARARAYIERARSALAECERESEEILQNGVAAFERGDGDEARRLLQTALSRGAPPDQALAVLDRLNRLEHGAAERPSTAARGEPTPTLPGPSRSRASTLFRVIGVGVAALLIIAAAGAMAVAGHPDWRSFLILESAQRPALTLPAATEMALPLPRRGEDLLVRARSLEASGHLHEALAALDLVRLTDPQRGDADRLRANIQRQLIGLSQSTTSPPGEPEKGDSRRP
jgi:tetratricopeptide (TPR) repeat protein